MLNFEDVSYRYRTGAEALRDVNCTLGPGLHLLAGENGAGKTTLLHLMAGLLYPSSGTCRLDGTELRRRLPSTLRRIQYFGSQTPGALPAADMREMVSRHACFFPTFDRAMLDRNMEAFGLDMSLKFRRMSAGTSAKAALAYMLALRCDVLLLDEPTVWLDPDSRRRFRQMLVECAGPEQTVVVSTHDLAEAEAVYDSLLVLRRGRLILDMTADAIAARLDFTSSSSRRPDALYSELCMGAVRCIVPAGDGEGTQPDFRMLYSALMSDCAAEILSHLDYNAEDNHNDEKDHADGND